MNKKVRTGVLVTTSPNSLTILASNTYAQKNEEIDISRQFGNFRSKMPYRRLQTRPIRRLRGCVRAKSSTDVFTFRGK